jgi:clan AA aspartic protease (TIGR02281 family)
VKPLVRGAALACVLATPAFAAIQCEITYPSNGDKMEWLFDNASDTTAFVEIAYRKNGGEVVSHSAGKYPLWSISINDATHTVTLSSRVDPGYSLAYFISPSPDVGGASMFNNGRKLGGGVYAKADPPAPPPVVAQAPATPSPASPTAAVRQTRGDTIPLVGGPDKRNFLTATIGGHGVLMLMDTGASDVVINESLANQLIAEGSATEGSPAEVGIANGQKIMVRNVTVNTVSLGSYTLTNVSCGVVKDGAEALMGMGFLGQFGPFRVDPDHGLPTFG